MKPQAEWQIADGSEGGLAPWVLFVAVLLSGPAAAALRLTRKRLRKLQVALGLPCEVKKDSATNGREAL
jgi:hypothetical protein